MTTTPWLQRTTGLLLIVAALAFNISFAALQASFDYPAILRQPTDQVLRAFQAGGGGLIALWYGFAVTALLFIPVAILAAETLIGDSRHQRVLATVFGVIAGLVQTVGLIRWPLLVPYLAETYLDPQASAATRDTVIIVFEAVHRYVGGALGEHLGYLFTALWTILMAFAMLRSGPRRSWLGWIGLLAAAGIGSGLAEPWGLPAAGLVNAIGYLLWSFWLIATGLSLLHLPRVGLPGRRLRSAPLSPSVGNSR